MYLGSMAAVSLDDAKAFVTSLYQSILGRAPDASGLDFWAQAYVNGMSASDLQSSFAAGASTELGWRSWFQNAYQSAFGAQPDEGTVDGFAYTATVSGWGDAQATQAFNSAYAAQIAARQAALNPPQPAVVVSTTGITQPGATGITQLAPTGIVQTMPAGVSSTMPVTQSTQPGGDTLTTLQNEFTAMANEVQKQFQTINSPATTTTPAAQTTGKTNYALIGAAVVGLLLLRR